MTGRFSCVGRFLSGFGRSVAAGRPGLGRRSLRLGRGLWVIIVWVLILNFASVGAGEITFDSGISDGMVVQRGQPVVLSGTGAPRTTLTLTLGAQSELVAIEDDGRWKAVFSAMPHGGPYTLSASSGSHVVCIDDVWVGDVWVASGQSNMQMGLAETIGGREVLAELSREPAIRFLEVPRGGADVPKPRLEAGPIFCCGLLFCGPLTSGVGVGGRSFGTHQQFVWRDQYRGLVASWQSCWPSAGPAQRVDVRHSAWGSF